MPLISILIPTKDRPEWALDALQSALSIKHTQLEIIFSDNCSKIEIQSPFLKDQRVRYFRQKEPLSMVDHWNFCINQSQGEFIKLLCDDDLLVPEGFSNEIESLTKHPNVSLVCSNRIEFSKNKEVLVLNFSKESILPKALALKKMVFSENFIGPPSSVSFRRYPKFQFPKEYSYACDWAAWIELLEHGDLMQVPSTSCKFRIHEKNLTNKFIENHQDFFEVQSLRKRSALRLKSIQSNHFYYSLVADYFFYYRMLRRIFRCLRLRDFRSLGIFLKKLGNML
ncbi:MAG: glycosyltransferase [Oligoflexia bacterium]|nr:glycosyltransferase [Oligoflexia bacterium]